MMKQKGTKRPPVPATLGETAGKILLLHALLLLILLCQWDISSASPHFNVGNEGFEMEEASGVSINKAAEAPADPAKGDEQDGKAVLQQLSGEGVDHVSVDETRNAWKKFGWPALGLAASLMILMFIATAWAIAAAAPKDKSLPTVLHEKDEKMEKEEKEKATSGKGPKEEGEGQGQKQEQEQEYILDNAADQLELQQHLHACWLPAQSLGASVDQPMSTKLLVQLKEHMDAAEQHQSAAEVGDRAAVAAIAAANQAAVNDLAALEQLARDIVMTDAGEIFTCARAALMTDTEFVNLVLESTTAARSYQQAWDQAVRVCNDSISFQKDEATAIRTQLQSFPPLQQRQLGRLPERLSAARVAVEGVRRCLKMKEAARGVARELRRRPLVFFKKGCLGRLELVGIKGAVLQEIVSALLKGATKQAKLISALQVVAPALPEVATKLANLKPITNEDTEDISAWSSSLKDANCAHSSLQKHLHVLRGAKSLQGAKAAADAAEKAGVHMSQVLDGLIRDLARFWKRHEQLEKSEVENTVAHPPGLPTLDSQVKSVLNTESQEFVAEAEEAEKLVLDVGSRIELEVARLRDLPWVPLVVLEDVKKALQLVMENTKKNRQEVVELVGRLQEEGSLDSLLSALDLTAKSSLALGEKSFAAFRLQEEVNMLVLLQGLVDIARETREAALQMVVGTNILQHAEFQRAEELQEQMEKAITTARLAASLPAVVHAVGEYVSASEKLHHLVWNRTFSGFITREGEAVAATQRRPLVLVQRESRLIAAESTKGGDIELRAPVQAAAVAAVAEAGEEGEGFIGQKAQKTEEEGLASETAATAQGEGGISGEEGVTAGEFGRGASAAQVGEGKVRGDEKAEIEGGEVGAEKLAGAEGGGGLGGESPAQVGGGRTKGYETPEGTEGRFGEGSPAATEGQEGFVGETAAETKAGGLYGGAMHGTEGGPSGGKGSRTEGEGGFNQEAAEEQGVEEEGQNESEEDDQAEYETATEDEGDDVTLGAFEDARE